VTANTPARILVADDHAVVREGLKAVINREVDLHVVAEAGDGRQAVDMARQQPLNLAILDVAMPVLTGLQATAELARYDVPLLLLSMYDREEYVLEALSAGARGYVLKREVDKDIVSACRAVLRGESFVHPRSLGAIVERYRRGYAQRGRPCHGLLTDREREVAKLIAEGRSSQQIATALTLSPKTVDHHRTNILHKLEASDRVDITRYAIRTGLVEP
jgi:DNA-binding NarL/FixJ family response regulator